MIEMNAFDNTFYITMLQTLVYFTIAPMHGPLLFAICSFVFTWLPIRLPNKYHLCN